MKAEIQKQLELLKTDYESVSDRSWQHFFCPILWRDEKTELCRGHVINQAFDNADRSWIVQRKDVDNHFGTLFESDFLALEQKGDLQVDDILVDKRLSRQFRPTISVDGQSVDFFVANEDVPESFSELTFHSPQGSVKLGLKISPNEMEEYLDGKWEIAIDKDVRLPALVSLLKSAHLTLFHMLGFQYALSAGGYFLGKEVLGDFFLKTRTMERRSAIEEAKVHFKKYQSLVRPVIELSFDSDGTLTDNTLLLCMIGDRFWAFNVFIQTGTQLHGVLVPILEDSESAARFHRFLSVPFPEFPVKIARMGEERVWKIHSETLSLPWPFADLDEPMTV